MPSRLVIGAHLVCFVNAKMLGRVRDMQIAPSSPHAELRGVDVLEPLEMVPEGLSVRGSFTIYLPHQAGAPKTVGLEASWRQATRQKYFSLLVIDRVLDATVWRIDRCRVLDQDWVGARGHVTGRITFAGLDFSDSDM